MDTKDSELPPSLPSLETALQRASEGLVGVSTVVVPTTRDMSQHPTILRMREARLQEELRKAERERRRKERRAKQKALRARGRDLHPTQKRMRQRRKDKRKDNDKYYVDIRKRYQRWTRRKQTKVQGIEMTLEEFAFVYMRRIPRSPHRLFETKRQRVTIFRKDPSKPWSLLNLEDHVKVGKHVFEWRKLKL